MGCEEAEREDIADEEEEVVGGDEVVAEGESAGLGFGLEVSVVRNSTIFFQSIAIRTSF